MVSISFDTSGSLYGLLKNGDIYAIDPIDGNYTIAVNTGKSIASIVFNPISNDLWGSSGVIFGINKEKIFKIDLSNGDTTNIGFTGLNTIVNDLTFDELGNLYGVTGVNTSVSNLVSIDTATAAGNVIGSIGFKNVTGIEILGSKTTAIKSSNNIIPDEFTLSQNYPNPFNPSTVIEFGLPKASNVKLIIYSLLGEIVNILVNTQMQPGYYKTAWNAENRFGNKVSSGIYFYELRGNSENGNEFSYLKKMILLK